VNAGPKRFLGPLRLFDDLYTKCGTGLEATEVEQWHTLKSIDVRVPSKTGYPTK
jgi:hypothetical protein